MSTQTYRSIWLKPSDPVDPAWFGALERLAAEARTLNLGPINPDHFFYSARIERPGSAVLHVYRHVATRKWLNVDEDGCVWRFNGYDADSHARYSPYSRPELALEAIELTRGNLLCGHLRQEAIARAATGADVSACRPGGDDRGDADHDDDPDRAPDPDPDLEPIGA